LVLDEQVEVGEVVQVRVLSKEAGRARASQVSDCLMNGFLDFL